MEQYYSLTLEGMGNYMSVNILLADDHMMVREGLKQLLEMDDDINVLIMLIKHNQILFF